MIVAIGRLYIRGNPRTMHFSALLLRIDNSKRLSCTFVFSGHVHVFCSGDVYVTMQMTSLTRKCPAVRLAQLSTLLNSCLYILFDGCDLEHPLSDWKTIETEPMPSKSVHRPNCNLKP